MQSAPKDGHDGDLESAAHQVTDAEALCARQRDLIMGMRAASQDAAGAERTLAKLEETLALIRDLQRQLLDEHRT